MIKTKTQTLYSTNFSENKTFWIVLFFLFVFCFSPLRVKIDAEQTIYFKRPYSTCVTSKFLRWQMP